jgi:signal transduction histidine kinase
MIEPTLQNNPKALHFLRIARSSSNLLLFLVNDTLDYFQIKSGKFKFKLSPNNLMEVVQQSFELI